MSDQPLENLVKINKLKKKLVRAKNLRTISSLEKTASQTHITKTLLRIAAST
jgi:hypothetical protein